ncbi:NAD-dependent epimerase/dehydratase family protein [Tritonibacter horizontis]|uniref:NAD dependent epimerase/dehydratase family protein n=1 Tax=Tritonibacter horizontis TaxID=1768241 RepID=A0A132BUE7_9RHOB|nr:NAD-dependent epimerase/dehydratase family protein [Tritonibacter horizontis]KUP92005.1 NAD dependent epimerase/dehydratase family protein [Tritonibacter horizontis]
MRIFLLGATGSIGCAILRDLLAAGHDVTGLCRSDTAARFVSDLGASVQRGDMRRPDDWAQALEAQDAVIQAAATFDADMARADRIVVDTIRTAAARRARPLRLIYTGGCWLYGDTGDRIADETTPFAPLPAFAWMLDHAALLRDAAALSVAVIHPGMVYHTTGGVFDRMLADIDADRPIEIWGNPETRWPLVHRDDLAVAYRLLVEQPELCGDFNAVAETGVPVGQIAATLARARGHDGRLFCPPRQDVLSRAGHWALGPMLDQQLSAARLQTATGWRPSRPLLTDSFPPLVPG